MGLAFNYILFAMNDEDDVFDGNPIDLGDEPEEDELLEETEPEEEI